MQPSDAPMWVRFLPLVVILVLLVIRTIRPMRISVTRMWVQPIILGALVVWIVWISEQVNPAPVWELGLGLGIGLLVGIPFGMLRGMHTDVRPTDRPGVMYLGSSWVTTVIYLAAFGLRFGIRAIFPMHGSLGSVIGDALLGFAFAFIVTSYVAIYRKYELEVAGKIAVAPAAETPGS